MQITPPGQFKQLFTVDNGFVLPAMSITVLFSTCKWALNYIAPSQSNEVTIFTMEPQYNEGPRD